MSYLFGTRDDDTLAVTARDDTVHAGDGDDLLLFGGQRFLENLIDGGPGEDTVAVELHTPAFSGRIADWAIEQVDPILYGGHDTRIDLVETYVGSGSYRTVSQGLLRNVEFVEAPDGTTSLIDWPKLALLAKTAPVVEDDLRNDVRYDPSYSYVTLSDYVVVQVLRDGDSESETYQTFTLRGLNGDGQVIWESAPLGRGYGPSADNEEFYSNSQNTARLTALADGGVAMVWYEIVDVADPAIDSYASIFLTVYNADGSVRTAPVHLFSSTYASAENLMVEQLSDGRLAVQSDARYDMTVRYVDLDGTISEYVLLDDYFKNGTDNHRIIALEDTQFMIFEDDYTAQWAEDSTSYLALQRLDDRGQPTDVIRLHEFEEGLDISFVSVARLDDSRLAIAAVTDDRQVHLVQYDESSGETSYQLLELPYDGRHANNLISLVEDPQGGAWLALEVNTGNEPAGGAHGANAMTVFIDSEGALGDWFDASNYDGNGGNHYTPAVAPTENGILATWEESNADTVRIAYNFADSYSADPGTNSDDTLTGSAGDDSVTAAAGDDLVVQSAGTDRYEGGAGSDTFRMADGGLTASLMWGFVEASDGSDTRSALLGFETIEGSTSDDVIEGDGGANLLVGAGGDDTIDGFGGDDTIDGGNGDDSITGGAGDDLVIQSAGTDSYEGGDGTDTFHMAGGGLIASLMRGFVEVSDQSGNQSALTGFEAIMGGEGDDLIEGDDGDNLLSSGGGNDTILGFGGNDSIIGTPFEDSIDGGAGRDTIKSGDGDDTIDGGAGNDAMYGGAGSDTYYVDHGSDKIYDSNQWAGTDQVFSSVTFYLGKPHLENLTLTGSANIRGFGNGLDNVLRGNSGDNRLYGNSGDDVIYGGAGNDTVEGWYGDDTLYGGAGNDRFLGGPGSDVYYITDAGDTVNESRWAGRDTIYSQVDFALGQAGHIENLVLQGTAITGRGNGLDNRIEGNAQDNVLTGNKGQDTLIGGAGDDTLNGEAGGGDLAIGGAGSDTYIVNHSKDIVVEEASDAGVDHVMSSAVFRLEGSHVENLTLLSNRNISGFGNELDNVITGNSGSNQLDGGAGGADTLIGGGANDIFHVRSTDDVVIEEAGTGTGVADAVWAYVDIARLADNVENVVIRGNGALDANGNGLDNMVIGNNAVNVLDGLGGNDTLRGNGGPDQFVFSTAPGSGNVDHIVDFTHRGDTIMLSTGVFNNSTAGALAADAFVNGTAALDANDRILYDQASGRLWYDANGSAAGGKVLFAVLDNTPTLDADDFAFF